VHRLRPAKSKGLPFGPREKPGHFRAGRSHENLIDPRAPVRRRESFVSEVYREPGGWIAAAC
jgi:hypothetical protein